MSVPTLVFYKNGEMAKKHTGIMSEAELRKTLEAL